MARELFGRRYLTAKNEALAKFITDDLPYLDYAPTLRWYRENVPDLDNEGRALLGCNDRYFLLTGLCKRVDALHPWLFQRCREVEADPYGYLDLWARYHYKSTIITFAGVTQEVVRDPEVTIAIMSCTNAVALPFLAQIKSELEKNDDLKRTYPDVFYENPRKESDSWSIGTGINVKRTSNPKECTVEAFGVIDGMRTGRHFRKHYFDDLINEKLVTHEEMVAKVTERYELADNLGSDKGTDKSHAGTRYSYGDTYGVLHARGTLKMRKYPATDDGTLKGKPVFLTEKRWAEVKKVQKRTAAAQMLQNPLAGTEQVFLPSFFRPYYVRPAILNVYLLVDPSKGSSERSDRTGMPMIGIDTRGNKYLLDGFRHRMALSERWARIKQLHEKWSLSPGDGQGVQLLKVGYEIYGQQADLEVLNNYMEREKYHFAIEEVNTPRQGPHAKGDRIERLEPDMREGRFFLPGIIYCPEHQSECLWSIWSDKDQKDNPDAGHNVGDVVFKPLKGELREHKALRNTGQPHRIVGAIKRKDEDGAIYDLTREFMEEAQFFPFAPKKDLIDAASRIYDLEPRAPVPFEQENAEQKVHPDT